MHATVYQKEYLGVQYWFVDYYDLNYELLPAVGLFTTKEAADDAARSWAENEKDVAFMGESSW
jgi:hypothetical protein